MEGWLVILGLLILGTPVWLIVRAVQAGSRIQELTRRLDDLSSEVSRLRKGTDSGRAAEPAPARQVESAPTIAAVRAALRPPPPPSEVVVPPPVLPPALPVAKVAPEAATPPPRPAPAPLRESVPAINWEQFLGVKMFAWVGGLALFLGVAFFVKYSFDNNLVPPELRVAIGFLTGLGLLVGGVVMSRRELSPLSQTLCATGVVILYAVTFACRAIYHFEFFGPLPTFLLMVLITTTAFFVAVRLNALVVAILGMLGGFLTPILLSTGVDNPLGLFGYIAILDAGLIVVALHRRWHFLTALGALGTAAMQIGWTHRFFVHERYFEGNKILIALGVLLGFVALHLAAAWWAKRRGQTNRWLSGATLGLVAVALVFTVGFLMFVPLAARPWLIFGFVFLLDLGVVALVLLDKSVLPAQPVFGLAVFGLLGAWTSHSLSKELLNPALAFYFLFAVIHAAFPAFLKRLRGAETKLWGSQLFAPLALVLVLIPIFQLDEVSFIVWPFVLLVDLLAIVIAVVTASLLPVLVVLVLTLVATGALIFKIPAELTGLSTSFLLLGAFAVFFVTASVWLVRKLRPAALADVGKLNADLSNPNALAALLPAFSAALPFLLLIMATLRLPLANPSPVFGLALLLAVLLLGLTKMFALDGMPAIGLACVAGLECAWHFNRFDPANATLPLTWYLLFFAVFTLFPFVFLKTFANKAAPWATAALAGLPQFFLIHRLVAAVYPTSGMMGLLPAAFAIPSLLSLAVVLKKIPATNHARLSQLAWLGGVALFFITLIFPIQFDRQWITIGWALEGAALLWLFQRVPHPGLRLTGVGLLVVAFVRLALNPEVLNYHTRSATPFFNWFLYSYGIVTVCLFAGARLLAPPRHLVAKANVPPILAGLGTALAFLLMNIEIADYFSTPGSVVSFDRGNSFAAGMTYTISWALFALMLIVVGIVRKLPAARYAALGLLCVALLKLFFRDLANLDQLYRIGAFIGVAVIAMLASFAYQKFFTSSQSEQEAKDDTAK